MTTSRRLLIALALACVIAAVMPVTVKGQTCKYGCIQDDKCQECVTDSKFPGQPAFYTANFRAQRNGKLPDGCYTSVYRYGQREQDEVAHGYVCRGDTCSFGPRDKGYNTIETQQFVYTNEGGAFDWGSEGLWDLDYNLKVKTGKPADESNIDYYKISFLGNADNFAEEEFTTVRHVPSGTAWSDGIEINLNSIKDKIRPDFGQKFGGLYTSYKRNPLHVTVIPMKKGGNGKDDHPSWEIDSNIPALQLFLSAENQDGASCDDKYKQWCSGVSANTLCCYLKADSNSDNTLPYDWHPGTTANPLPTDYQYGDFSSDGTTCFLNSTTQIRSPYTGGGYWRSSLNSLLQYLDSSKKKVKIVLDPKTTANFPISNRYTKENQDSAYVGGYDFPDHDIQVEVTGYGRINGYDISRRWSIGDFPTFAEFIIRSQLMWISLDGQKQGNNAWPLVQEGTPEEIRAFRWSNGDLAVKLNNNGKEEQYGISVSHVQVGYTPPLNDSTINLGDFKSDNEVDFASSYKYGASVVVKDFKYTSFSTNSDPLLMKNPASYGSGLFLHGADDMLKSSPSADNIWWVANAITYFAGHQNYGSLSCPCCFGTGNGFFGAPQDIKPNSCSFLNIQDVVVPVIKSNAPMNVPGYPGYTAGVITTRWQSDPTLNNVQNNGQFNVQAINYKRWKFLENGFNFIDVPIVNWVMNSIVGDSSIGIPKVNMNFNLLGDSAAGIPAVNFKQIYSIIRGNFDEQKFTEGGFFSYNWGVGDSAASVDNKNGFGVISAIASDINSRMDPTPCGKDQNFANRIQWGVCPVYNNGFDGMKELDDPGLCYGYKGKTATKVKDLCPGSSSEWNRYVTASIFGQDFSKCKVEDPPGSGVFVTDAFCGLRFSYDSNFVPPNPNCPLPPLPPIPPTPPTPPHPDDDWDDDWSDWDDDWSDDDDHHSRERRSSSRSSSRSRSSVRSRSGSLLRSRSRSSGRNVGRN